MSSKTKKEEVKNIDIEEESQEEQEEEVEEDDDDEDSEYDLDDCALTNVDMYHILKNFLENDNGDRCVGESLSIIADKLSKIEEHIKSYVKLMKHCKTS